MSTEVSDASPVAIVRIILVAGANIELSHISIDTSKIYVGLVSSRVTFVPGSTRTIDDVTNAQY